MTNQPSVPGFIPGVDEDLDSSPEEQPEGLVIQDTEVIDATQIDASTIEPADEPQG